MDWDHTRAPRLARYAVYPSIYLFVYLSIYLYYLYPAPSKSGRGAQADETPTRVPSPGATAALGVSPTSKVVASAPW